MLGPLLALLPRAWREACAFNHCPQPGRAATVSGVAESAAAIFAICYWYIYAMSRWIDRAVEVSMTGKLGHVSDQQISGFILSMWAAHPLTWLLGYFVVEGAVRFCAAAFTDTVFGTLPLFLIDRALISPFRPRSSQADSNVSLRSGISSFVGAIREKALGGRRLEIPDQLRFRTSNGEEFLEILASRRKDDWTPPRTVRYESSYYRLESYSETGGPRPFRYSLRLLPVGVPGRSVLLYTPAQVQVVR